MRKTHSGFGVIGIMVLMLVIAVIGLAGWLVTERQSTDTADTAKNSIPTKKSVNASDSTKSFSYSYPSNWTLQKYVWQDCCDGPQKAEPDWTKQAQPITLKENANPIDAAIKIDDFGPNAIEREYSSRTMDRFNTYTKLKVNGYDALYHVTDFVGPSEAEKYKDNEYIISNTEGTKSVRLQFRERYRNSTTGGKNDFDASSLMPDFQKVAHSVKFLDR
jgi:hypothetical protein